MANAVLSEIKYLGNAGGDFIEIRVDAGADVSGVQVVVYNQNGSVRSTNALEGSPTPSGPFDIYLISVGTSSSFNGVALTNAIALVEDGTVTQFVSFDDTPGVVLAGEGPAEDMRSEDIGEAGSGASLERQPDGSYQAQPIPTPGAVVPCFTPGTMIRCPGGGRRVETLQPGDLVCTADHGDQPIRWTGHRTLSGTELTTDLQPIRIDRTAFGGGFPRRDLTLSPLHRIVIRGSRLILMTGEAEGFATAKSLVGQPGVRRLSREEVTYVHLLFDDHEVVFSNGWATESLNPGDRALTGFGAESRSEVLALFPELATSPHGFQRSARPLLKPYEVRAMGVAKSRS